MKRKYTKISVKGMFYGIYTTDEGRQSALKKIRKDKSLKMGDVKVELCFGDPGKDL